MKIDNFFTELKRRNVIRFAGLYLVGSWLLVQVASTVLPMFGAPDWLPRSIVILLALGFIPALIFAWVFELTPAGLKRDAEVPAEESIAPQTAGWSSSGRRTLPRGRRSISTPPCSSKGRAVASPRSPQTRCA